MIKHTQRFRLLENGITKSTDVSSILIQLLQNNKRNTTNPASSLNLAVKANT